MRIIFIRHGETIENRERIIQGHLPGRLSQLGLLQARLLGQRLNDENIDAVETSDLKRAVDTTAEIIRYHPFASLIYSIDLRERSLGSWEGKSRDEIDRNYPPPNIESWGMAYQRARRKLDELLNSYDINTNLLLSSHGGFGRAFIAAIKSLGSGYAEELDWLDNASLSIYELNIDRTYKEVLFNCTAHLKHGYS